ncbi:MAG TPA: hypothetical protein PKO33_00105 [Pyrinomonadaceae bacterium]|nr:hypothetical protein [Pyrinomonadaceae bacterium]
MKRTIAYLLILTIAVIGTACPSKTIETAEKKSAQLAGYANQGVEITRAMFREQLLTLEQKDKVATGFIALAQAGQTFDETVKGLKAAYGPDVPRPEIDKLFEVFSSLVVGKFLDVLRTLKVLPADSRIGEVIDLLRLAVLTIAKAFGRGTAVRTQLEAV